ncbi:MAG: viroplasmin family protein [Bacteroidales bacterium]
MVKKKKFYAVWEGHETGFFDNWKDCERAIKGYPAAKYKSFESEALARQALGGNYWKHVVNKSTKPLAANPLAGGGPIPESISVDAAYSSASKDMEYQGVYTKDKSVIFRVGPLPKGTNNVGEFLALVHALALCKQRNIRLPVYTDSMTAMAWIRNKKAKTILKEEPANEKLFDYIDRAENWLKNNTWNNKILKWDTENWGEIPADFGRK